MLIFAAFSIIVGILSLLNLLGENRNLVIGILLVLEAVLDITVFFLLRHALKKSSQPVAAVTQAFESDTPAEESPAESPETPAESPAQEVPATEETPAEAPAAEDTPATEKE